MLIEQIKEDLKQSMREGDNTAVSTLRMLISAISYYKMEKKENREDIQDEDVETVIAREIKKRRESVELYRKGAREEQAQREEREIEVLSKYLPEQMSEDEIQKVVDEAIQEVGAEGVADMGKVMGALMPKTKGKADGSVVSKIVRARLSS